MSKIRKAAFSGMFYPAEKNILKKQIQEYLDSVEEIKLPGRLKVLIVPHAGYVYSGPIAATGYKLIHGKDIQRIVLLGPSHNSSFEGLVAGDFKQWMTPLGNIKQTEAPISDEFSKIVTVSNRSHTHEHSIEVQVPFIQECSSEAEIYPLLTGNVKDHKKTAELIEELLNNNSILIISSDLSHYLSYKEANHKDKGTIEKIISLNTDIDHLEACGRDGILIAIHLARNLGLKGKVLDYRNSGDTAGDKKNVVGYTSIAFYEK